MRLLINLTLFLLTIQLQSQYGYVINWSEQNSGVSTRLNCIGTIYNQGPNYAFVCGDNGIVLKTSDAGLNWINTGSNGLPSDIDLYTIAMFDINRIVVAGNIGNITYVYRTDNGGSNWQQVFSQVDGRINSVYFGYNGFAFLQGNPVGGRWSLWKSSDHGVTWDSSGLYLAQQGNETGWQNSFSVHNDFNGSYKIWFGTNNQRIYYSPNSGNSWEIQPIPEQNIYAIAYIGRYLVSGGSSLYSSTDNGPWALETSLDAGNINGILAPGLIYIIPYDNLFLGPMFYIRSNNKIYYTDSGGGADWEIKYASTNGNYTNINCSSNTIWALRDNGGITSGKIDVITSVPPNTYPYSFELRQNYPNPFNPKTTIPIVVYKSTHISLKVYDSNGKLISTLFDGNKEFSYLNYDMIIYGVYFTVEWDAANYPSGVYFYEVVADDYKESRKMMLIK